MFQILFILYSISIYFCSKPYPNYSYGRGDAPEDFDPFFFTNPRSLISDQRSCF